ncbi:MAG TPA: hypothetical protein VLC97_15970, partial [Rhodanobacteraceae bacterium]|nr:hypothetical protein [Rhodanobacteraceae bacterium]
MNSTPVAKLLKTSLALAVAAVFSGSAIAASSASALVPVAHTATLQRGDAVLGALPKMQPVHVEVVLKLRNRDVLDAFNANNANNQAHGMAAQPMSRDQFLANHAPTQ